MERASTSELKLLTDELARGMEKAMQLRLHLCSTSPSEAEDLLLQRIISTFENALCFLNWNGHIGAVAPETSVSADASSGSDDGNRNFMDYHSQGDASKKRKLQRTWMEQVKVDSENGLEGPGDDGYSWRKYGQKDILGAKYPRSYYRCTYRQGRNCWATKQVQRSDEDPTVFDITYKGEHTCQHFKRTAPPPAASPKKQGPRHYNSRYDQLEQNPLLSNFKSNLRVNTEVTEIQEMPAHFSFPSAISPISPVSSGLNYFSTGMYRMREYGGVPMQYSETDIADMLSARASTTNSPVGGMELSMPVEIDPDFPFNIPDFFT